MRGMSSGRLKYTIKKTLATTAYRYVHVCTSYVIMKDVQQMSIDYNYNTDTLIRRLKINCRDNRSLWLSALLQQTILCRIYLLSPNSYKFPVGNVYFSRPVFSKVRLYSRGNSATILYNRCSEKHQVRLNYSPFLFYIDNIRSIICKPCTHPVSTSFI